MKVVIIDDSMLIRVQLRNFFKDELGYDVVGEGETGIDAIDLYKEHKADLLTLDMEFDPDDVEETVPAGSDEESVASNGSVKLSSTPKKKSGWLDGLEMSDEEGDDDEDLFLIEM